MQNLKQSQAQWQDFIDRELDPYAMTKYRILLDWMGELSGKRVLVVGSGSGEFAALMALRGGSVLATDIDQPSVDLTLATARKFGVELVARCARLEDIAESESFDVVAATDVIEHIEDDGAAAEKLKRLVRRDGQLVITVPAMNSLFGYHDEILGHFRRYSRGQLLRLFDDPGLNVQRVRYFGFLLIPVAFVISRLLRRPYPVAAAGAEEKKGSLLGRVVRFVFGLESWLVPPLGTSLLMIAKKA